MEENRAAKSLNKGIKYLNRVVRPMEMRIVNRARVDMESIVSFSISMWSGENEKRLDLDNSKAVHFILLLHLAAHKELPLILSCSVSPLLKRRSATKPTLPLKP